MGIDEHYMRRALDLARSGVGLVSPNPAVGAVVVDPNGKELGSGSHRYDDKLHAEIIALAAAGDAARGATLYLNLEPCSHYGRTGPCADAIIAAKVRRVVCAMEDPNPEVAGAGFARLSAAGIAVDIGLLEAEAKKLNEAFAKFIRTGRPLVTLKSAMSLDAKIASACKRSQTAQINTSAQSNEDGSPRADRLWISGEASRAHVQQLRHESDAILVGVGTVLADDPLLTDRTGLPRRRKLLRVILDSSLRTPVESQLVKTAADDVLVLCCESPKKAKDALLSQGVRICEVSSDKDGRADFAASMRALGEMRITSVMVEGGSTVNRAALSSGQVDKLFLYYAPTILGADAVPFLACNGANETADDALRLRATTLHQFGEDFAIEGYLHDPYVDK